MDLEEKFKMAEKGNDIWTSIDSKYDADLYIVFPHVHDEYNYYALLHLDEFLKKHQFKKVVIICADKGLEKSLPLFTKEELIIYPLEIKKICLMLKYYALYEFTTRMKIVSLTIPYDTRGERFLGIKGGTKEELLCYDIYRFEEVTNISSPFYDGEDKEIIGFLALGVR